MNIVGSTSSWTFWQTTHARARTYIHERECARTCVHTQDVLLRGARERGLRHRYEQQVSGQREKERETHTQTEPNIFETAHIYV